MLFLVVVFYFLIPQKENSEQLREIYIENIEFNTVANPTNTTLDDITSKPRVFMLFFRPDSKEIRDKIEMLNDLHKNPKVSVLAYMLFETQTAEEFVELNGVEFPIVKPSERYTTNFPLVKIPTGFLVDTKRLKVVGKFIELSIDNIEMSLSAVE